MIDRRSFIHKAVLIAAGSASGFPLTACGDSELVIPCLGPAPAPVPVPGMTYIRASEIGCALDCKLETGRNKYTGGDATDDGPRINAAMAGATADNPITLIIDGSALISGLFLPAGGYWNIVGLGCGTGFFVKTGTNNDGIHNGPPNANVPSDPGPPAPPRGLNVSLSNFTLNGNQGNGHNGNSTSGTQQGSQGSKTTWYFGINLMNLNNITLENVVVVNTPAYHIRLSNVGNVVASGCVMQSHGPSTDGLHVDGPANDITISNCDFTTGDDSIALNCPEGYSGNISRVTVSNCTFNSYSLMRLYTSNGGTRFSVDAVSVSNCSGTLAEAAFLVGFGRGSGPNSVASLTISDCSLTAPDVLGIAENFGTIALSNVTFVPSQAHVSWVKSESNRVCGFLRPSPLYDGIICTGSGLSFENCVIYRSSGINVIPVILENNSTIDNVSFNGFSVQDAGSYFPVPELVYFGSGSIAQLVLGSVTSNNIKVPVSPGGFSNIRSVSGAGVLATGWKFPDNVMANGVPYISASSGLPSVKIGGVVKPYPQL
ncbi:glycosyl hydrolase family 28 [Edaphobacter aggregans]|uniref:Glycosyl hydrolase family 28 n=1 Tax=Edaphobacter aggregans TaxID=570835 RepID=A0A428MHK5_9BACT|nr:glycosyl hydrolase family 28 protein [Edaphobacter aggregans]RSL16388.1 glycosyl hydrolase family 28 [Edaphobacter aggregans]